MFKKTVLICTLAFALLEVPAHASQRKHQIDLADLAPLGVDMLDRLMDEEHAVFVARVQLAASLSAGAQAKGSLRTAGRVVGAEKADLRAARAELKAAKKNSDTPRAHSAQARLSEAEADMRTAELLEKWKKQEAKWRAAQIKESKALVDSQIAQLELAQVRLIADFGAAAAAKYGVEDYRARATDRAAEYRKLTQRAQAEATKSSKLRTSWLRIANNEQIEQFDEGPGSR